MMIIGCDYHPGFQQIAFVDTETGELQERRLQHREEAEKFYRDLAAQGMKVRVGMEASGHARWFERLLAELQFELWIGDAAEIRTKRVRKQKTDRQDAQLILQLMLKDRFSADLGAELGESGSAATAVAPAPDGAGAHADHEPVASGGAERRTALQEAVVAGSGTRATGVVPVSSVGEPATARSAGVAGPTEPDDCRADAGHRAGSGEVSRGAALADASRSGCADGAGVRADHRESGSVSVWQADRELSGTGAVGGFERESATAGTHHANKATRCCVSCWWKRRKLRCAAIPEWRSKYFHLAMRRGRKIAKVAMARRLAVRLYWMWRKGWDYEQLKKFGSHAGQPGHRDGVQSNTE